MRGVIESRHPTGGIRGTVQRFAFRNVLPSQPVLRALGTLARVQSSALGRAVVEVAKTKHFLPETAENALKLTPKIPARFYERPAGGVVRPDGAVRGKAALFTGCVMPVLFGPTQQDSQDVLVAAGFEVHVPDLQTCCGALQAHAGERRLAKDLAKRNIDAFGDQFDVLVINSAGCGSLMKEYGELLEDDPVYRVRAAAFSAKVRDISEVLANVDFGQQLGRIDARVSYQDACHLAHGQKIRNQPRQLLRAIPGLTFVELPSSDRCCGSAGIYNLTQPQIAASLLDRKIDDIARTEVQYIVAGNPGCLIQIQAGLRERGVNVKAIHTVSLLAESIRRGRLELPPNAP
jgi:glycolate oxidase iron-sulfur subunit